jgi:integrase/recombinase XerC
LKRRNFSTDTVKNYLNGLKQFLVWVDVPIEQVDYAKVLAYIDFQLDRGLKPKSINCHLSRIRLFYDFLRHEQGLKVDNPVKPGLCLRVARPLPKHLKDEQAERLLDMVSKPRDRAMFLLMLRSGLRVAELAQLTFEAVDFRRGRLWVRAGKGNKDRVVYVSPDAMRALVDYIRCRPKSSAKRIFLVEKGTCRGDPLSVRGIQKRMEYYARKAGLASSCHHLRHTMATQMLNAGAELSTIQDLLGHRCVTTTQQYCKVSNLKVQKDYYEAMEKVMKRTGANPSSR